MYSRLGWEDGLGTYFEHLMDWTDRMGRTDGRMGGWMDRTVGRDGRKVGLEALGRWGRGWEMGDGAER